VSIGSGSFRRPPNPWFLVLALVLVTSPYDGDGTFDKSSAANSETANLLDVLDDVVTVGVVVFMKNVRAFVGIGCD